MSEFVTRMRRLVAVYGEALLLDVLCVVLAYYLALALRFSGRATLSYLPQTRDTVLVVAGLYILFNALFGLYGRIWRYASSDEIISILESATTATLLVAAVDVMWPGRRPLPLSVVLAGGLLTLGGFAASRYRSRLVAGLLRRWKSRATQHATPGERVIIVGAGEAGQLLAWRLRNADEALRYRVIGFVDDDPGKQGLMIHGVKVVGGRQAIPELVQREAVELIVIAIHKISSKDFDDILSICQSTPARIKTPPDVFAGLEGRGGQVLLRDITIEDLVGREQVSTDRQACRRLLADKCVLVSGAGGSIGSELCRQIVQFEPRLLLMLDNNETSLHDLALELLLSMRPASAHGEAVTRTRCVVADVTLRNRMTQVFREFRPEIILHAAAYKHVPLMEEWPEEALRVNVGGTLVLHELAAAYGSERFVFVSTDKAVEPTCVMGSTKWLAEMLVTGRSGNGGMVSSAVRFGNVLGSRGSVSCIFQREIDAGGPVTVTHPEASRFFMSVGEAASMILQAASLGQGGEVFILDMGEQIRITDLAHKMIRLRGLRVGQDVPIVYSGLRPGEKLHEKLVSDLEEPHPTSHPRISCVRNHGLEDRAKLLSETLALLGRLEEADGHPDVVTGLQAIVRAHTIGKRLGMVQASDRGSALG